MSGSELRALRKERGLTQRQLADILGVTRVTINRSEKRGPGSLVSQLLDKAMWRGELRKHPNRRKS